MTESMGMMLTIVPPFSLLHKGTSGPFIEYLFCLRLINCYFPYNKCSDKILCIWNSALIFVMGWESLDASVIFA